MRVKSIRRVSSAVGLGADSSRVATCKKRDTGVRSPFSCHRLPPHPPPWVPRCHLPPSMSSIMHTYLLVVSSYQAEDVTSICYGQEVTEEEGQASVEAFSQLHVLGTWNLSVHIDSAQPGSPLHDFLNSWVFIPDFLPLYDPLTTLIELYFYFLRQGLVMQTS